MKLTYHWEGEYLIPDLIAPESLKIGSWGERRRQFPRSHRKPLYDGLMMEGILIRHLEEIDRSAKEMFALLTEQLAEYEGVTELLKATNQLVWVQKMNDIQSRAAEIVNAELIFS